MYDDPMNNEPPPPFPRCPNCNEQMTDHPLTTEASKPGEPLGGAICAGPDGCGWWGTWHDAEEYAIALGEARAEAMADAGPDWHSEYRPGRIPVPGVVPFEDDPEVSRWLAASSYESPEAWMRDSDYYESEGGWYTDEGHGPIEPLDAIAGAMLAVVVLALAAEEASS